MALQELHCINRGHKPTFVTANRRERLDVTLVSTDLLQVVSGWEVMDEESMSDHKYIHFVLRVGRPDPIFYQDRRKTNWDEYLREVSNEMCAVATTSISSTDEIEERVTTVSKILREAQLKSCPLKKVRSNGRTVSWWTPGLTSLRSLARRLYRYTRPGITDQNWIAYCDARNRFNRELRKAKKQSWRKYCGTVEEFSAASQLYHILKDDSVNRLGPLERGDGSYTTGIGESLELLLEKHFPRDPNSVMEFDQLEHEPSDTAEVESMVSETLVKRAIRSFGPFKAAGEDGIFPAMLQKGPTSLIPHITEVIKACLTLGYTPKEWRVMKVVFIPKPGKDSYERVSSWRPISLTSFWLKTMERLVDWHIRTPSLIGSLKGAREFAYMAGVSTEAALHQIVARMERTLKSREVGLATVLDVEGAFSHATFRSIYNGLCRHRVGNMSTRWILSMLTRRSVSVHLNEVTRGRTVERGCPQGGVLSPLLWNLVVDEILVRLKIQLPHVYSQGFADDLALYNTGIDLATVSGHMQEAINMVERSGVTVLTCLLIRRLL